MKWWWLAVGLICWASEARAQEKPAPAPAALGQEHFAFGPTLGFGNPNGLQVRAGDKALALDVTAGFAPILFNYGDSRDPSYKLLVPFEVSPQIVIHALTFRNEIRGAVRLGYRYNVTLGHGATLGAQIHKRMSRHVALEGAWTLSYYPNAAERLRGDAVPDGASFNFPPQLNAGLSVSLLYYP